VRTSVDDDLPIRTDRRFAAANRVFDEFGNREVVPQLGDFEVFRNGKNGETLPDVVR
jgi:hypothetical protein